MSDTATDLLPEPRIISAGDDALWDDRKRPIGSTCASADGSRDSSSAHGGVPSSPPYSPITNSVDRYNMSLS